jgi:GH24 family phage-related lysozyme (muramidase)
VEENGKRSRYQAHIECLSMDANLPDFLRNPDQVGEQEPAYLKYPQAAPLFVKNFEGQMVDSTRKTRTQGIATLFKVPVEKIDGQPAYYRIYRENGWLAAASVRKLSQYALAELGFITLDKAPESFDLIDGSTHPDNVVKGILERLYKAAQDETRTSHALNQYNYKRLLEMIDSQRDGHYSEKEYLQAVHNVSYRDYLYRIIVKHASEWYYGKDDPLWKTYLDTLTLDAPQWKTYIEALIDNMTWMKKVDGMGPEPWHMHPVVFLSAFSLKLKDVIEFETSLGIYKISKKAAQFILSFEGYVATPYVPDGDNSSGVTLGYGYDLGQQNESYARNLLSNYYTSSQIDRLITTIGRKGDSARSLVSRLTDITITKEQAFEMAMELKKDYCQQVVNTYPQAINLPPGSAGAILSLVYNRGPSLALPRANDTLDRRREMREIKADFDSNNISRIPGRLRSMKRLWVNQRGLRDRREGEAQLIEDEL